MPKKILFLIILVFILIPGYSQAGKLPPGVKGKILLQVEENGEAWYVNPDDHKRYFLGRPADAFVIMRQQGLGIKHSELATYINSSFPARLSGKIMLDVEANGEAYYVFPDDLKGYYLGRPADAFSVMRNLGLGITNDDLNTIYYATETEDQSEKIKGDAEEEGSYSFFEHEINRLIASQDILGPGHYEWIVNGLKSLKDTGKDVSALEEKLSDLNVPGESSQTSDDSQVVTIDSIAYQMDRIFFGVLFIELSEYEQIEADILTLESEGQDMSALKEKLPILRAHVKEELGAEEYVAAAPDPLTDYFTWTLPTGASALRLSLPADIDNFLFNEHGGVGGYGLHAGGHIEGLDHTWIELIPGTPVKSWADGVVIQVNWNGTPEDGEYHIRVNYGYGLIGWHGEVGEPYVEVGELVSRGQEIALGASFSPYQSSAEMGLVDKNRSDGVSAYGGGVTVSPFDYLEDNEKQAFVAAYKEKVITPYVNNNTKVWGFEPSEPYLTNDIFIHKGKEGKLSGVWYLTNHAWQHGYPNDMLVFIEADNPYFAGNVVRAYDFTNSFSGDWTIGGTFEVDYAKKQVKLMDHRATNYGIFTIDESGEDAVLKIEYREGTYPASFTSEALIYTQRSNSSPHEDALRLGIEEK